MTNSASQKLSARLPASGSFLWLLVPLSAGPLLAVWSLLETQGFGNAARSLADSMILLIPALAVAASLVRYFTARTAAVATIVFLVLDTAGLRGIAHEATRGLFHQSDNPSWMSVVAVLASVLILTCATLGRATMARVVLLVVSLAQVVVLLLFHQLLVISPIGAERENESALVSTFTEIHGSPEDLCGADGRRCYVGEPDALAVSLGSTLPHHDAVVRILRDTSDRARLLHVWTEMILPSTDQEGLRHITVFKSAKTEALVMVNEVGPTRAFAVAKTNFGVLASLFHQAWISLSLIILWRHGQYSFRRGRWERG